MQACKRRKLSPTEFKPCIPFARPRALPRSALCSVESKGGDLLPSPVTQRRLLSSTIRGTRSSIHPTPSLPSPFDAIATPSLVVTNGNPFQEEKKQDPIECIQSTTPTESQTSRSINNPTTQNPSLPSLSSSQDSKSWPLPPKPSTPSTSSTWRTFASGGVTILSTAASASISMLQEAKSVMQASPEPDISRIVALLKVAHDLFDDVTCDVAALLEDMGVDAIEEEELTSQMQVTGSGATTLHLLATICTLMA